MQFIKNFKYLLALPLAQLTAFEGGYVGVGVGISQAGAQYKHSSESNSEHIRAGDARSQVLGSVFAGYGWMNGNFYIGPEASFDFGNQKLVPFDTSNSDDDSRTLKVGVKKTWSMRFAARFGYRINEHVMAVIGLGIKYSPWVASFENISMGQWEGTSYGVKDMNVKQRNSSVTFSPSVGMEVKLIGNIFGRFSYIYDLPIRVSKNQEIYTQGGFINYAGGVRLTKIRNTLKLSSHTFKISLGIRF